MSKSVHIICEGFEEYKYLKKLQSLFIFSKNYDISLANAEGSGSVFYLFQNAYNNDNYDLVLICIDTDRKRREYNIIKEKVKRMFGSDDAVNLIIFSSPCIMQIIILHYEYVQLKSQSKKSVSGYLKKYINFEGEYDAHSDQLDIIMETIDSENYKIMKNNLSRLPINDGVTPSSNFLVFLDRFENDDVSWIDDINKLL